MAYTLKATVLTRKPEEIPQIVLPHPPEPKVVVPLCRLQDPVEVDTKGVTTVTVQIGTTQALAIRATAPLALQLPTTAIPCLG